MKTFFILVTLILGFISSNAFAYQIANCQWEQSNYYPLIPQGFKKYINDSIQTKKEYYACGENGSQTCSRTYYELPQSIYTIQAVNTVTCINNGDEPGNLTLYLYRVNKRAEKNFKDIKIAAPNGAFAWLGNTTTQRVEWIDQKDFILEPCQTNCGSIMGGFPQIKQVIPLTISAVAIKTRSYVRSDLQWDSMDYVGNLSIGFRVFSPQTIYRDIPLCIGLENTSGQCVQYVGGNDGGNGSVNPPPPPPVCTVQISTPNTVEFQPITSDDLSRNRVRMTDFTLVATKGPSQSSACIGTPYNIPGILKPEGGYMVNDSFWGINAYDGTAQGIGLKIYDLDNQYYMKFNSTYSSFIRDINTSSETKRFRAEIAATTEDIKKIQAGEYSQVITFEVRLL
ncbi:fimbrial protein [Providencia rettgeri]|uniref:fimbrial protein n=1 Tax=Providencia rettgeri TaxID=587 RepID=UPI0034E05DFC